MYAKQENLKSAEELMDLIDAVIVEWKEQHPGASVAGDFIIMQKGLPTANDISYCCGDWLPGEGLRQAWVNGVPRLEKLQAAGGMYTAPSPPSRAERRRRGDFH